MKPEFITSDVHLGAVPDSTERAFVEFLEHVGSEGRRLLLPGDLFDFWFEYGDVVPGEHFRVLAALSELVDAGVGGRFLEEQVGVTYHPGHVRTEIAGRPAILAHGDGLGRGDLKYRALKMVLRSRPVIWAFRALHPEIGMRVARAVSTTEAKADTDPGKVGRAEFIEQWARDTLDAEPELGYVVCGHAHLPTITEVQPGRYYLNAGDWLTHLSYITVPADGTPTLRSWTS